MAQQYKTSLAEVCSAHFGDLNASDWKTLVPLICEDVLKDAHDKAIMYHGLLTVPDFELIQRPCKRMTRIVKKASIPRVDIPFKVNSDLCAFQIPTTDLTNIDTIMETIEKNIKEAGGMFFIRNSIKNSDGNFADIIQFAFAYVPAIGYIAEIQVGHPFAMYTFKRDSLIRDMRDANLSTDNIVDLWDNDLYSRVKAKILEPGSGDVLDIMSLWQSDKEPMPQELCDILSTIISIQ